MPWDCKT